MRLFRQVGPGVLAAILMGSQTLGAENAAMPAVWKEQSIDFSYFGRTSRYSCDGIRDKLRSILALMGVRRDPHAVTVSCADTGDSRLLLHEMSPSVQLIFSSPSLPDASAKPARAGDLAPLDAQFTAFSIVTDAFRNLQPGDCELVEEFVRQVLPKLTTRNVETHVACIPHQLSGSHYSVRGEVLMPVVVQ
jgi:hypothetical protein